MALNTRKQRRKEDDARNCCATQNRADCGRQTGYFNFGQYAAAQNAANTRVLRNETRRRAIANLADA